MNEPRSGLGVAAVDGKIYAIGGSKANGSVTSSPPQLIITNERFVDGFVGTNEEYDPTTDSWTCRESMPTARIGFATAVYQEKIYCMGGRTSYGYSAANEVYNPKTDTWEIKASMPNLKAWTEASVVEDKIYLVGVGVYDPTRDIWSLNEAITSLNGSIKSYDTFVSSALDNRIFIVGGYSQDNYYNLNHIYDADTDVLCSGSNPPSSVAAGCAAALDDKVYVLGCPQSLRQNEPNNFVRIYDPTIDNWTLGASPPISYLFNFGVANVEDKLYVIGGLTYNMITFKPSGLNQQYTPPQPSTPSPTQQTQPDNQSGFLPVLIVAPIVSATVVAVGLLVYLKKHRRQAQPIT
jgi:N-acetylneuraminic acid mutarotase